MSNVWNMLCTRQFAQGSKEKEIARNIKTNMVIPAECGKRPDSSVALDGQQTGVFANARANRTPASWIRALVFGMVTLTSLAHVSWSSVRMRTMLGGRLGSRPVGGLVLGPQGKVVEREGV